MNDTCRQEEVCDTNVVLTSFSPTGECTADGGAVCAQLGGITIGNSNVQWCVLKGDYTIFGPACYNEYVFRRNGRNFLNQFDTTHDCSFLVETHLIVD